MLDIIGGTYIENCIEPDYHELFGSGLRAAIAISNKGFRVNFRSCVSDEFLNDLNLKAKTFGFNPFIEKRGTVISFDYYHPLSQPYLNGKPKRTIQIPHFETENVLYYGLVEAKATFKSKYTVYDPQNHRSFRDTGGVTENLALILNKNEAYILSGTTQYEDLKKIGKRLLDIEKAKIIVIKNGSNGAIVIEENSITEIPVFETTRVWPIGSGDIFSAVFAWQWMINKKSAKDSALLASQYTAHFCQTEQLPLKTNNLPSKALAINKPKRRIYLAGPFFTISERWLINEIRHILLNFENDVFSPFHDAGYLDTTDIKTGSIEIATKNIENLKKCDVVLAVGSNLDAGTLFEIGYAKSLNKRVVVLLENVKQEDLTMLLGTECEITSELSSAIYKASW